MHQCPGRSGKLVQKTVKCQPGRLSLAVTAMSKRGPKSERRAAKEKVKQGQTSAPQQQQESQQQQQTSQLPAAVEEASQPQAATPLAEQPVSTGDDATTVGDRILPRILLFSGVPVFLGLLLLPGFYYLKVVKGLEVPTFVVYAASFVFFGAGLAGITYGIFSASWDPRREGTLLGTDEFKENLPAWRNRNKN